MKLHKEKVEVLEAALAQHQGEHQHVPELLRDLNERIQVIEPWRQRAKKAVESSCTAWMSSSHQSYYEHLDRTSRSQISEVRLGLRMAFVLSGALPSFLHSLS
jgi:hypothetical protein